MNDEQLMEAALVLAKEAAESGEVPIGAVITLNGEMISKASNLVEARTSVTRHAEIVAIEEASAKLKNWRLTGATLYVTLEPCPMCMAAIRFARVSRVVFGAFDPRLGACGSHLDLTKDLEFGGLPEIQGGVLKEECLKVLQDFFKQRRLSR